MFICDLFLYIVVITSNYLNHYLQVTKFQNGKYLGTNLLNAAQQVVEAREVVASLMERCEKIAAKTENAISEGRLSVSQQPILLSEKYVSSLTLSSCFPPHYMYMHMNICRYIYTNFINTQVT